MNNTMTLTRQNQRSTSEIYADMIRKILLEYFLQEFVENIRRHPWARPIKEFQNER